MLEKPGPCLPKLTTQRYVKRSYLKLIVCFDAPKSSTRLNPLIELEVGLFVDPLRLLKYEALHEMGIALRLHFVLGRLGAT